MTLHGGTKLGPYEIVSPLGAGGMGEVYRARDTRLDRDVAIKILPAHLTRNMEFRQRFEREAKSISQLSHPNICTLFDVGHQDGTEFLVMELLEGESLAQRLSKGPLPLEEVLKLGAQIAAALGEAHRKGVVHRDLKPGNIMLTRGGAKLLDFGLAKSAEIVDSDPSAVTVSQPLTSKGTILGTFQYMAPEQLEGIEADARTDIFALGAVLYEMATGKRAFEGASRASLIASIMSAQPRPISEIQPLTPPALDRLIRKCLAKGPDARWQSAADVADELRWIAEGGSQVGHAAIPINRRRRSAALGWGAAAVVALASMTLWLLRPEPAPPTPLHMSVNTAADVVIEAGLENLTLAIAPDGQSLAYCGRRDGGISLFLRRLGERDSQKLAGTEGAYDPFFSPDGEWIGFFSGQKMRKISVRGGVSIPLADSIESRSGTWADPQTIVFSPTFGSPLIRLSENTGTAEPCTEFDDDRRERSHRWPEALPGGEWVVFTVGTIDSPGEYDNAAIEAVSLKTGERRVLIKGGRMARYAPPGYLVFARDNVLLAAPLNPADPRITSPPVPVLDGVSGEDTSGASHFSIARNGTLAYVPGETDEADELVWVDLEGNVEPVGAPIRLYDQVRVSPDGTQLLLASGASRGSCDCYLYDLSRGVLTRLTFDQKCTSGLLTPDQRHMVFRTEVGPYQIIVQSLDGGEAPRVIHTDTEPILISSLTPDGKHVLFQLYGSGTSDILTVPLDGSEPARALWEQPGAQYGAVVSPDGKWLAYVSQETGVDEVCVRPASGVGGKWQVSTDGGVVPVWAPSGKEIYYVRVDAMMAVPVNTGDTVITAGAPRKLFDLPAGRRSERDSRSFDIAPDGKRFVIVRSAAPGGGRRQINMVLNWSQELQSKVPISRR